MNLRPEPSSKTGMQLSSVHPGYTVDSKTIHAPLDIIFAISLHAEINRLMSGLFLLLTGVGTVTIKKSILWMSLRLFVNLASDLFKAEFLTSPVTSNPLLSSLTLFLEISYPITLNFFAKEMARGRPTYPRPKTAIL